MATSSSPRTRMYRNRFQLPGFGLPLNFMPSPTKNKLDGIFTSSLNSPHLGTAPDRLPLTTLRELTMLNLMNRVTDMPDWHLEIFDKTIISKRRAEALAASQLDVSEKMLDWCVAELQHKTKLFKRTGAKIPIWNLTLTPLKSGQLNARITYESYAYETDLGSQTNDDSRPGITRRVVQPEPGEFLPFEEPQFPVDLLKHYLTRGLQIIVKLTDIHLTPEKPVYSGDTWHVDGLLNERICATAIYCYDRSNISKSYIAFRQQSNTKSAEKIVCPPSQRDWLKAVFGCEDKGPAVQDVGVIHINEGRLITWPNILQHKFQPFRLVDPTKPGHCKILTLFLVDPSIRIISTANVPCQRKDWWIKAVRRTLPLPVELQDLIFEDVGDFPIGLEDARRLKSELLTGREALAELQDEAFRDRRFSLRAETPEDNELEGCRTM
ncbi:hypothetical protein BDZ94DRAFT_1316716 [Collybia nuda]|uniref:Uncharacterized protein n=1 Tax=Collybia nuda TaxID=64659 RepID=A0A9P6CK53_9AGAR|nr:hypothetical protein BDZ94DRAFT_1316716 [Collybia nuda]